MSKQKNGMLLRGAIYHARINVPADIRHLLEGKKILTKSLKTGNKLLANELASTQIGEWKALFRQLREQINQDKANQPDWKDPLSDIGKDIREIREVLHEVLYAPDVQVRYCIINGLCNYIQSKFADPEYKLKVFIAYQGIEVLGFVIAQLDPNYTSYSRKCGTFGWLYANSLVVCKNLMKQCELFMKENKVRKMRGPIN
ncbi:hypothetical protein LCGC14_0877380, partial [marine sediment metagenome]